MSDEVKLCPVCGTKLPSAVWLLHEDTDVWECSSCHTCFELANGVSADKFITYCPVCGTRLFMPE